MKRATSPGRLVREVLCSLACLGLAQSTAACNTHTTRAESTDLASADAPVRVRRIQAPPGAVVQRACSPTGPELCFNARDDNCNGILDEGCGVQTGLIQFSIAWAEAPADVDLNVTDPAGELVEVGRVTDTGLTKDRDCPGRQSECHGQNMENVFLERNKELTRGRYRVRVRLEKLGGQEPPIIVTFGARAGPKTYAAELTLSRQEEEQELIVSL